MEHRELGNSGLEVSVISMGCWAIAGGGTWGPQDEQDAVDAIRTAYDEGIDFFDTAEGYGGGASEEILGRAVGDFRDQIVLASKVSRSNLAPDDLRSSLEASLQRLGTDYLDLYYIHWPNREVPVAETLGAMEELKDEGKIRAIGVSNFGPRDLSELCEHGIPACNQLPYNLLWRAIEYEILPICAEHNISVTCYSPIAQGLLAGKFATPDDVPEGRARTRHFSRERPNARHDEEGAEEETFEAISEIRRIADEAGTDMVTLSLAWLLSRPEVGSVIAGARNPDQIRANVRAVDFDLSPDLEKELTQVTEALKARLGKNPDMWMSDSRYE